MSKHHKKLGPLGAVWNAFFGRSISYYPRLLVKQKGRVETLAVQQIMKDISTVVSKLDAGNSTDIQAYLARGRESLDEVKSLTEYQDQKATRLLTIIAFLSALSGALFAKFVDLYPLHSAAAGAGSGFRIFLLFSSYALFALFILCAASGALVIFYATRTTFKYPSILSEEESGSGPPTSSYIFFSDIVSVSPAAWANSFLSSRGFVNSGGATESFQINPELSLLYLKNYIVESYLIACKVADKLRYLQPAQAILSFAIRVLILWVIFMGSTWVLIAPVPLRPPAEQGQPIRPPAHLLITQKPGSDPQSARPEKTSRESSTHN